MTFAIKKPAIVPARGQALLQPVEKLNFAMQMLSRQSDDPLQSAVRVGELVEAGILQFDPSGLLIPGSALGGSARSLRTFKNYFINGDHRYAQRGSVWPTLSAGRFVADRFHFAHNLNTGSASRQLFPIGQTDVPGKPTYFQRLSVDSISATPTAFSVYYQRIENLGRFAGKKLVFSWYVKANAPREISMETIYGYGTGGSATEIINAPRKYSVGTNWSRVAQTVIVPSLVGKTHNSADSSLLAQWWLCAGTDAGFQTRSAGMGNTTGIIDIACVQCEDDEMTDFEFLPDPIVLIQCQRYYETSYSLNAVPGTAGSFNGRNSLFVAGTVTGQVGQRDVRYKVSKRGANSVVVYNDNTGAAGNVAQDDGANIAATINGVGTEGFYLNWTNTAGRYGSSFHYASDAEW